MISYMLGGLFRVARFHPETRTDQVEGNWPISRQRWIVPDSDSVSVYYQTNLDALAHCRTHVMHVAVPIRILNVFLHRTHGVPLLCPCY